MYIPVNFTRLPPLISAYSTVFVIFEDEYKFIITVTLESASAVSHRIKVAHRFLGYGYPLLTTYAMPTSNRDV